MKKNDPINFPKRISAIGTSLATLLLIAGCAGEPPTAQIAVSRAAVNNASAAGGNEFAPLPLRSAMNKMEQADQAMMTQDYSLARQLAEEAEVDAQLSMATARAVKAQKAVSQLRQDNNVLRQEIDRKTQ